MRNLDGYQKTFLRTITLACVQSLLLLLLGVPLLRLQLFQGKRYVTLAENNHIVLRIKEPRRGELKDRHGKPLATNQEGFRLLVAPHNRKDLKKILKKLEPLVALKDIDTRRLNKRLHRIKNHLTPLLVKEQLTWEEISRVALHSNELDGVYVEPCFTRVYPLFKDAFHILGYVATPNAHEEALYKLARTPYTQVGKMGLEKFFQDKLRGKEGAEILELNAKRQVIRIIPQSDPVKGQDIYVSLDSHLQQLASRLIASYRSASVVILNAETGEVLALVSHPSVDPHSFRMGIASKLWHELQNNPYKPLLNKPLQGLYAPGSTIKPGVVLAALENGCAQIDTTVHCQGVMTVAKHPFHCWMHRWGGHGNVSTRDALVRSCDIFIYEMGKRLKHEKLKTIFQELGLGNSYQQKSFLGARVGLVPDRTWKRRVRGKSWTPGDTMLMSIGQGAMLSTPLEIAVMGARLATGKKIVPSYNVFAQGTTPPVFKALNVKKKNLKFVQKSLFDAVNTPRGTVYAARVHEPQWRIAGKTGTSQVQRISLAERREGVKKQQDLAWKARDHALYMAFSKKRKGRTQFVVSVIIEHGGWGSRVAAPIGSALLKEAQKREDERCTFLEEAARKG